MEIKPIKTARRNYPTLQETLDKPELLEKNAPARWLKNGAVAGALGAFILMGCNHEYPPDQKEALDSIVVQYDRNFNQALKERLLVHRIAPLFVHGDGTAFIGCVVMGWPIHISENDAIAIIKEEFRKHHIEFDTSRTPTIELPIDPTKFFPSTMLKEINNGKRKHKFDGINRDLNLVFDFISGSDSYCLESEFKDTKTSVDEYGTKFVAESIRDSLLKADKFNAAIFYDPMPGVSWEANEKDISYQNALSYSYSNLRAQVADFIIWAKNEGLIK